MKKTIIYATILFCFSVTLVAQNISGQAYYESKTTVDMDSWGNGQMSEEQKKMIASRMKSYLEKTFILSFSGNESVYQEEEVLETGAQGRGFGMMMKSFSPGVQYKNLETNVLLEEREFFGKEFLIEEEVNTLDWEVTKESKQIGQYIVFKATATKKIDPNDFSMARPRRGRDANKENVDKKESDSTKVKDPMDAIEIPKEIIVTAWFTPQIPIKNGPAEYAGLPGLILELNYYRTTLLCSKIVMQPKKMEPIKAPTKGKKVTRKEYNEIVKEKTDQMRENFRGRGNRRGMH